MITELAPKPTSESPIYRKVPATWAGRRGIRFLLTKPLSCPNSRSFPIYLVYLRSAADPLLVLSPRWGSPLLSDSPYLSPMPEASPRAVSFLAPPQQGATSGMILIGRRLSYSIATPSLLALRLNILRKCGQQRFVSCALLISPSLILFR